MPGPPVNRRERPRGAAPRRAGRGREPGSAWPALWAAGLLLAAAGSAGAQTIRPDFDITNGTINATVLSGNTLYIGGSFTSVGPVTGAGVPLDAVSGVAINGFPKVVGQVTAVASDGSGGWYIGGLFTTVGGVARSNLAHILSDNSVSSWDPGSNGQVLALAVGGGRRSTPRPGLRPPGIRTPTTSSARSP